MQIDLPTHVLQEIALALNLKVIAGVGPDAARAALQEFQTALQFAQAPASVKTPAEPPA
jgi:hypothetical protein